VLAQGSSVSGFMLLRNRFSQGSALNYRVYERVIAGTRLERPVLNNGQNLRIAKSHANREVVMRRINHALLLLLFVPVSGVSQSSQHDWGNLKELRPGQKVEVIDNSMKSFQGPFVSVSEEAITLKVGKGQQSVERANVVRVNVRDTSHRKRNMLLGAGILGGIAVAATAVPLMANSNEGNSCPACAAVIAAGFGGGAALGAIPGSRTVYRIKK
jgi:hypothetical protein